MSPGFSSCFRPSSVRRRSPLSTSGCPNLTTCIYHTNFALFSLSWSQSLFSHSLLLHFHQNLNPFDSPQNPSSFSSSSSSSSISFRLLIRPLIPWKKHGSEKLSDSIHVFWDLRRARFSSSSPEPCSGFFIAVVVDGEMTLLVGDMIKEASKKIRAAKPPQVLQTLILKREHVTAHKIYTTKAKFAGQIREIQIDCGFSNYNDDDLGLSFSVDGKRVLEIKRLKWKFRGNERIEVAGVQMDVYWDVYNWVFELEKENRGNAVFMFRFEEEIEEQSNQQQNWNLGLNELEWRRMRSSLSSSSISFSTSTSSVGSSAGASSSVMEWANSEDSDQIGAPLGFSLLIYAWRR
ncbi:DUF868 domain-containing protein [Cucumis melo var. makuwa]|uniref:DUF868 domain-containing protein n=2 Tax=Cucumis melo TaxID=3656 RepID=A0A5D3D939_CUCMM|nr:DUF868 domain-containing protein [Cucumis melo var. makuwa]TYK19990.1 DUF868 domain-containing protein [Cucumis melo var. makuwa]